MKEQKEYQLWLEHLPKEDPLRKELIEIREDPLQIKERFHKNLTFGTAGLRGKLGAGSNRMNVYTVGKAAQGIANYITSCGQEAMERGVVIAYDPRHFSREFCHLSARIFAANKIKAYIFSGIRPTPQLSYTITKVSAIAGVNITASHNPKEYNGYKVYWEDGCQIGSQMAQEMTCQIEKVNPWEDVICMDEEKGMEEGKIILLGEEYDRAYLDKIEGLSIYDKEELDLSVPIVYTPLNGCGSKLFGQMLEDMGFTNWKMVKEQEEEDPDFTTVGYPNPEDPKAFALSEQVARRWKASLIMATDPDADRFAIEVLDDKGEYVPLNGNQTGYLLVYFILQGLKNKGKLPKRGAMVKSIVTSTLSTKIAQSFGVEMFETLTGFKNICGSIPWLQEEGYTYLFGYEESVGYACCPEIRDKDGISAGMMVAQAAAYYQKQGKSLWQVLQEIYKTYGYCAEDASNLVLEGLEGAQKIKEMMKDFRENLPQKVASYKVVKVIDYLEGYERLEPHNALRIFLDNDSWFALRPSGTEPKIKFYIYSKGSSLQEARKISGQIKDAILERIQQV